MMLIVLVMNYLPDHFPDMSVFRKHTGTKKESYFWNHNSMSRIEVKDYCNFQKQKKDY